MDILGLKHGENQLDRVWRRLMRQICSHAHRFIPGKTTGLAGQRKRQLRSASVIAQKCKRLLQRGRKQSIIPEVGEKCKQ